MSDKTFAEFSETLTLEIPNISQKLSGFSEAKNSNRGLIIEVAAIHAGLTANFNHYGAKALEQSLSSWVSPYPKPIILNHDLSVDPIGRVMAAKMDTEKDGTPFVRLQIAITDPSAIEKISDQRYLTGSVGGRSEAALCSVCGKDWAEATMMGPVPCRHIRGRTYKGQLAFLERIGLGFKEYSFVNNPADSRSQVLDNSEDPTDGQLLPSESDGWVASAKFFSLNMEKEEVLEYTESEERDLLQGLKKKESAPLYLSLKGAFLSSLAFAEELHDDKEIFTVSDTEVQDVEDVLAVTEELSEDLLGMQTVEESDVSDDSIETDGDEAIEEPVSSDEEVVSEEVDEPRDETVSEDVEDSEDEVENDSAEEEEADVEEAATRPQGQEKARTSDVDSKFNRPLEDVPSVKIGGDKTREEDESDEDEESIDETELEAQESNDIDFELLVEEMISREEALVEENARLKKALHRMLAERVVDAKIALGIESMDNRSDLIDEHVIRSASSLADTMRDLAMSPMKVRPVIAEMPEMDQSDVSITDDGSHIDGETTESVRVDDPMSTAEQLFVDALMGRRKL